LRVADDVLDRILDADTMNGMLRAELGEFRKIVQSGIRALNQAGRFPFTEKPRTKLEELLILAGRREDRMAVLQDPAALPGDQSRAQQEEMRFQELTAEVLTNAE